MSRKQLESRIVAFREGPWMELLRAVAAETAHTHNQSVSSTTSVGRSTGGTWNNVHIESFDGSREAASSAKGRARGGRSSTCWGICVGFDQVPHLSEKGTPWCCGKSLRHDIIPPPPSLGERR